MINSALVSAQNRNRLYWVGERQEDWSYKQVHIVQPLDKGILLKDILEEEVDEKYYMSNELFEKLRKFESNARLSDTEWKSYTLNTMQWWHRQPKIIQPWAMRWRNIVDWKRVDELWAKTEQRIEIGQEEKAHTITSVQKDSMIIQRSHGYNKWWEHIEKCPSITSHSWQENNHVSDGARIRKLTPIECERLQTIAMNTKIYMLNIECLDFIDSIWLDQIECSADVENKNHKLQNVVLNAGKEEKKENAWFVEQTLNLKNQQTNIPAPENVLINWDEDRIIKLNIDEQRLFVNSVEKKSNAIHPIETGDFAQMRLRNSRRLLQNMRPQSESSPKKRLTMLSFKGPMRCNQWFSTGSYQLPHQLRNLSIRMVSTMGLLVIILWVPWNQELW